MSPKNKGQHNQRQPDIWLDQHGREYFANIEIETNDPIDLTPRYKAPLTPTWAARARLFTPPLDDREIVTLIPRMQRHRRGHQILIDYDAWLRKRDQVQERQKQQIAAMARTLSGGNALELIKNPSPELQEYIGPPPFPPREIILSMKAGNPWALGLSAEMPEKAAKMMDELKVRFLTGRPNYADEETTQVDPFAMDAWQDTSGETVDPEAKEIEALYAAEQAQAAVATAPAVKAVRGGTKGARA